MNWEPVTHYGNLVYFRKVVSDFEAGEVRGAYSDIASKQEMIRRQKQIFFSSVAVLPLSLFNLYWGLSLSAKHPDQLGSWFNISFIGMYLVLFLPLFAFYARTLMSYERLKKKYK